MKHRFSAVRQGLPITLTLWVAAAVAAVFISGWMGGTIAVVGLLVLLFFRDPRRTPPQAEGTLLAPVDGRVVDVRCDESADDGRFHVAVFMSLLNVHVVRVPCGGTVRSMLHVPGGYGHAGAPNAALVNEHLVIEIETDNGSVVTMVLVAGMVARRIVCPIDVGDKLIQGEKIGMIRFGSRVEIETTNTWRAAVAVNDRVRGGMTVIGETE